MRQHSRTSHVARARLEMSNAIALVLKEFDLTYVELWTVLNEISASWAKYALRAERHPDEPDKPADVE